MEEVLLGLDQFHARERWEPTLWFLLPMAIWIVAMSGAVAVDSILAAAALSTTAGVAGSQLFVLGHDACHGSYTCSRVLNAVIGRLAFIPSAHNFSLWAYYHNGLHHNFTNLRGYDFVWTPLSPDDFSRLSLPRRFLEYLYRHPTGAGFGLYYALELWRSRLVWPAKTLPKGVVKSAHVDIGIVIIIWLAVGATTAYLYNLDGLRAATGMMLFAGISLTITSWAIGFVVFFNHTHPRLKWYESATEWRQEFAQAGGSCHVTFSGIWWYVLPNVVMNHTLHHLDTRIPVRSLAAAEHYVASNSGVRLVSWRWTPMRHYAIMKRCGLYDYARGRWISIGWKRVLD